MVEQFSAREWVEQSKKLSSRRQRRDVIAKWVVGNGFLQSVPNTHNLPDVEKKRIWDSVFEAADKGISELRQGTLGPVKTVNAMLTHMENKNLSPTVISGHKLKIVKFYRFIGVPLSEQQLEQVKETEAPARLTDDQNLKDPQIKAILIKAKPKTKALFSFMICTGARLGESVQVKISDIDFNCKPAIVRFPARKTKTSKMRYSFLSSECVGLIQDYIRTRTRKSEWVFEGFDQNDWSKDQHISKSSAWMLVHEAFIQTGLVKPKEGKNGGHKGAHESYHPNVLRGTCLAIMKRTAFKDSYAEFLVGHSTGAKEHYFFEEEVAPVWLKECEPAFCFLTSVSQAEMEKEIGETNRRLSEMEKAITTFSKEGNPDDRVLIVKDSKTGEIQGSLIVPPAPRKTEVVDTSDNDRIMELLGEGYEFVPNAPSNGHVYLRRKIA